MNVTRNRTGIFNLAFTQSNQPLDISQMIVKFAVTDLVGNLPVIIKDSDQVGGISKVNSAQGLATLTINPDDTTKLPDQPNTSLIFELILINGSQKLPLAGGSGPFVVGGSIIPDQ